LVSGVLLLTPGFITDAVGLLGLIPWSRLYFINQIFSKNAEKIFTTRSTTFIHKNKQQTSTDSDTKKGKKKDTIEGEFWED
jgi:UPF0716 protein FxsA